LFGSAVVTDGDVWDEEIFRGTDSAKSTGKMFRAKYEPMIMPNTMAGTTDFFDFLMSIAPSRCPLLAA
jgi:hypothetical protein